MKKFLIVFGLTLVAGLVLSACGLLQEPEEASGPIEAIPLAVEDSAETEPEPEAVEVIETPVAVEEEVMEEPEPVAEEVVEDTVEAESAETESAGAVIYSIVPGESIVRFELDEDLRGNRITVVGTTDQVAGELALDLADLSTTQVGVIQINARTLETDNNFRNRAIQNDILDTGSYEFITFTPTAVNGMPDSAAVGDSVTFTIDGDLTVKDVTLPATFEVTATLVSESQIEGTASTIINRDEFGLSIPSVPSVANVEAEIELYIDLIAQAQ
jgi:polyisoprenoid-binding protein YceI